MLLLTQARASSIVDLSRRWFESDVDENLQVMSDRAAQSGRAKVHPLFPLVAYPVTYGIMSIGKLPPLEAVFAVNALTAGLWLVTFYAINRLVDCRRLDSLLFTGLAATSGAALFWFIVPETYPIGSLTILLSLLVVALARRRRVPDWCFVLASAATLSITVTNWMAGLISTAVRRSPRRAIALSLTALVIVAGLAAAERLIFFRTKGFFASPGGYALYKGYLLGKEHGGPLNAARVIFLTSEVVPRIELSRFPTQLDAKGPQLTIQRRLWVHPGPWDRPRRSSGGCCWPPVPPR